MTTLQQEYGPDTSATDTGSLDRAIKELVARNRTVLTRQGTLDEYSCVRDQIVARRPCNLLVFGVGRDSQLWLQANPKGKCVFVEHHPRWIALTREEIPSINICQVEYNTRRYQWRRLLSSPAELFMGDLPHTVGSTRWDVIFVDGPQGNQFWRPGRMKSIYTAAQLAHRSGGTDVLLHDCNRRVEKAYADEFLGPGCFIKEVGSLRHYRTSSQRSEKAT